MLKHLLNDDKSLTAYFSGQIVVFEDVKRRMLLMERNGNRSIPDQHYRLQQENEFEGIKDMPELLTNGILKMASEYLELRGSKVYVIAVKQNEWQELITYIPPLILMSVFLQNNFPLQDNTSTGIIAYFNQNILYPNALYTALPYPYILQLENYRMASNGFNDLHMHLNGAIETDNAWQDFLAAPEKIYYELVDGFKKTKVKEQFEQESHLLDPVKFHGLLLVARKIRKLLFDFVFPIADTEESKKQYTDHQHLLSVILSDIGDNDSARHPFQQLLNDDDEYEYNMAVECLMYVLVTQRLSTEPRESIAWMFHFYLLILGLSNRLLVQQTHQYGFEQFQKHTLNNLRGASEKEYRKRFFQMHGNELANIKFLEGKFSPQKTEKDARRMVDSIYEGWDKLVEHAKARMAVKPELTLVAHFIKKAENNASDYIRFDEVRRDLWQRGIVLSLLTQNHDYYRARIRGIDAAASEFDTPPEVFAPTFRMLRRAGIEHFTYHAGEDFYHILSGLRAMYEAMTFTEMKSGDRIAHATAAGISAERWYGIMGPEINIRRGDWLDNLLFVYHIIIESKKTELKRLLPFVINDIQQHSFEIYGEAFPVNILIRAWHFRKYCPILALSTNKEQAELNSVFDHPEWELIKQEIGVYNETNPVYSAMRKYHDRKHRNKYNKIITIKLNDIAAADIQLLQLALLKIMHEKEIVIETLPTSNVRIGHYNTYKNYHLWNWLRWEEEGYSIPPIVVGSDDTGIFATNIYNEYANIYCCFVGKGMLHTKVMAYIERLDKNGSIYKFT